MKKELHSSIKQIARRLGVTKTVAKQMVAAEPKSTKFPARMKSSRARFKIIHEQAVNLIVRYFSDQTSPVSAPMIRDFLRNKCGLRVSLTWLQKFLKERLGMSYKV